MKNQAIIDVIKQALDKDPTNIELWIHYGDLLATENKEKALDEYRKSIEIVVDKRSIYKKMLPLLRETGNLSEALIRAEMLLEGEDDTEIREELVKIHKARGHVEEAAQQDKLLAKKVPTVKEPTVKEQESITQKVDENNEKILDQEPQLASVAPDSVDENLAEMIDWDNLRVSFKDVAGLEDVKKQIHLRIIAPFKNPKIYQAFKRSAGGGILLYGPPGCGKTFIARATATECGAQFVTVNIHDIVDKYWGESEKIIHTIFDEARRKSPTILFFDEFDALGSSRGKSESQFWKTLVNQLLQEMDGVNGKHGEILLFAATNMPWNIDPAFRRPGRFDRVIFIPSPDEIARIQILKTHVHKIPGAESVDIQKLAKKTNLFTGADLKSLCERACENALAKSLETNTIHPVVFSDFETELKKMQSSAEEWISAAKNYARYANESGQYDELREFLKKYKRW